MDEVAKKKISGKDIFQIDNLSILLNLEHLMVVVYYVVI